MTTEIVASKAAQARNNFDAAGLSKVIDVRVGNALETLHDITTPIDFLLLDGWKDLYLPLFKQLEPHFTKETLIYTDNADMADAQPLFNYINSNTDRYATQTIHEGKTR